MGEGSRVRAVQRSVENKATHGKPRRSKQDFKIRLTWDEVDSLRTQNATLKKGRGVHSKYPPLAFSEQGVAMLSGVLKSPKAIAVNIEIMHAFIRLRTLMAGNKDLARRLTELERKYEEHDIRIKDVFLAIRNLMGEPDKGTKNRIGFV